MHGGESTLAAHERGLRYLIFASPKSGTTWVQRLLSAHPDVHCAETRLFGDCVEPNTPSGVRLTLDGYVGLLKRHYFAPAPNDDVSQKAFYDRLLFDLTDQIARTCLSASGKRIYGEKLTPLLGSAQRAVDRLHQYNPDVAFVHLVRDGRDVVVSGAAHWLNALKSGGATADQTDLFEVFVRLWTEANEAGMRAEGLFRRFLRVRYEDMLREPVAEFGRILEFIGARNERNTVGACLDAASFERLSGGRARGEEDAGSFFRKGVAGDWKGKLTAEQAWRVETAGGRLLERLGYG